MFADSFNILKLIEVANKKTERHDQNDSKIWKAPLVKMTTNEMTVLDQKILLIK